MAYLQTVLQVYGFAGEGAPTDLITPIDIYIYYIYSILTYFYPLLCLACVGVDHSNVQRVGVGSPASP